MKLVYITLITVFAGATRAAPTFSGKAPTLLQPELQVETIKSRSFGTGLDYLFNPDWNNDLFKYYKFPYSFDLGATQVPQQNIDLLNFNHHHHQGLFNQEASHKPLPGHVYNIQLFFEDIPHTKLLLENQENRKLNELPLNNLGSLRVGHPFERPLFGSFK
ncbi:unnamed protein product [Phyllotreta striolata]|uniref:Secreted protein n=1 Tax=Phyllotreta striolata TaxID=444603 RepID=A0A9N9XHL3_PHYSR|nr:unnamed protein product [Phyllotreta striolata]